MLDDDAELTWQSLEGDSAHGRLPWVELKLDAQTHRFKPVYSLKPSIPELESILATWSDPLSPILVAPELITRILVFAAKSGWQRLI